MAADLAWQLCYCADMHERPYQKLSVWQEAHKLCLWVYDVTKTFPADEKFGLISQMRRSASSVPTNITEGNVKASKKEKAHFMEIAHASLEELHYWCYLSKDLNYMTDAQFADADARIQSVSIQLTKFRGFLKIQSVPRYMTRPAPAKKPFST